MLLDAFLLSRALLQLGDNDSDLRGDLSAAAITPDGSLWLASDELQSIERLTQIAPYVFGKRQSMQIGDFLPLPDAKSEIDIEGMDYTDHYLWLTGSHSLKRKKTKGKHARKDIARIATVQPELNRFLLARIPVIGNTLFASCSHPEHPQHTLSAAALEGSGEANALIEVLREDEHLGPFLSFPLGDKENGFNIEGIAVQGNRVFLGLRGPVLDGWAIILEVAVTEREPGVLVLAPTPNSERAYKKHFLDLDGLGVRELQFLGDDLLVLAGPTMHIEGAMKLFRFKDALNHTQDSLSSQDAGGLEVVFVLPFTLGADHAEGMTCLPCLNEQIALLLIYDAPHASRRVGKDALFADIFRLPHR
jgi:hypothetical protein